MNKVDLIIQNLPALKEWKRLNGQIIRLGLEPNTALRYLEVYNKVKFVISDGYNTREAFKIIADKNKEFKNWRSVESIYYNCLKKY